MILLFYRCKSISAMLDSGYNDVKMMLSTRLEFSPSISLFSPYISTVFQHIGM